MVTVEPDSPAIATRRVLVIDDEPTLIATLRYNLEREGMEVLTAMRGDLGFTLALNSQVDLVILDVMLPGIDGLEICRLLRKRSPVPILMLTARAGEVDKVVGLEVGADDYLTKPFSMRELLARVHAILRRADIAATATVEPQGGRLVAGEIEVDFDRQQVTRSGRALRLKPKELQLLLFFARHPGRVFTREQLLDKVWGYDFVGGTRTVDVHVRWLREKIEANPSEPASILTVRGTGYRFEI